MSLPGLHPVESAARADARVLAEIAELRRKTDALARRPPVTIALWAQAAGGGTSVGAAHTTLDLGTKVFDTHGWLNNTASNSTLNGNTWPAYSYMPQVAGYYHISGQGSPAIPGAASTADFQVNIWINNSSVFGQSGNFANYGLSGARTMNMSGVVYLNGSTDYVRVRAYSNTTVSFGGKLWAHYIGP